MIRALVPTLLSLTALVAAEPLGMVESVNGRSLVLRFDASATSGRLAPGGMVAIYAPGQVEKHPLTKEVIIERPVVVAKAQLTALAPATTAKVLWLQAGAALIAGLDAVPISEAAPNGAPVAIAATNAVTATPGQAVTITLPLADPDSDAVGYSWSLSAPGRSGQLAARTTAKPEITWQAPLAAGQWVLAVTARDVFGQEGRMEVPLSTGEATAPVPREGAAAGRLGEGAEPALSRLRRDADGRYWGVDGDGKIWRADAGWRQFEAMAFSDQGGPKRAIALVPWKGELYVLDANRNGVGVYGPDGSGRRWIPGLEKPTDLAVAPDGAILVADQGLGGVMVFEPDGRCRARLGRPGTTPDAFTGLSAVSCDPTGAVYALDSAQRRVARYDRFLRSLMPWTVPADEKDPPVDVAATARGCLVLLASGRILAFDHEGKVGEPWPSLDATGISSDLGRAQGLLSDTSGETLVTFPAKGVLARYSAAGQPTGARGAGLRGGTCFAADGLGRILAVTSEHGQLAVTDSDGWLSFLLGLRVKDGGPIRDAAALATTPDGRLAFVVDRKSCQVVRFDLANPLAGHQVFGQKGTSTGQISSPMGLAADDAGRCYVVDDDTYQVSVFDAQNQFTFAFSRRGTGADELDEPKHLAVNATGDRAYVYDADSYVIKAFALDHQAKTAKHLANSLGKGDNPGQFRDCVGIGVDRQGLVWAVDAKRGDVQILDFRAGAPTLTWSRKLADLGFKNPGGLALTPDGTAWIPLIGSGFTSSVVGLGALR
jgi:DNA-binding beta-propeller fold protein YncE